MIMLVGPVGAGKTSLLNALQQNCRKADKTQSICFTDGAIDTPGEYAQIPRFYSALMVTAAEAKVVLIVQDATDFRMALPPGFAAMFSRPVVGVVTKLDAPGADREKAKLRLMQAGIKEPIFYVSAHTGTGLSELSEYLSERGCK
ncbi:Propanediol utilization protein PduV [Sporomusa carbonis]|uniref:EutP/PduV family microcompartment system protein n=1 Tax=Sporomusa carbonis TaxID=3076075 RepID=UPI003A68AD4A